MRQKVFKVDAITNNTSRQSLLDSILNFYKDKKQEFTIKTGVTYETIALFLLDRVTVDYPTVVFSNDNAIPIYGVAVYGTDVYPNRLSNFTIENIDYGILGRRINLKDESIEFNLREV